MTKDERNAVRIALGHVARDSYDRGVGYGKQVANTERDEDSLLRFIERDIEDVMKRFPVEAPHE